MDSSCQFCNVLSGDLGGAFLRLGGQEGDGQTGARAPYVGRFAPTPSGPLHLGSLLAAVASWLDARSQGGRWRLRIDDLDAPRVAPGAEGAILRALEAHALTWDGPVVRQRSHLERHRAALAALGEACFGCACSRRQLRGQTRYPGTCRCLGLPQRGNAVRLRVPDDAVAAFEDRLQGRRSQRLAATVGDFPVWRRDDIAAYPLAVVVDDAALGVTHVVRGADLLAETPRQIHLAERLGIAPAAYAHVPVLVDAAGEKLSKHNAATAIDNRAPARNLATVLALLGLEPPEGEVGAMLRWARQRWRIDRVPAGKTLPGFVALS